jgi:hypothetical protein
MPAAMELVALALAFLGATAAVPAAHAGDFHLSPGGTLVIADDKDCTLKMRVRSGGSTWKIQADGCFEVTEDENDILEMPAGGWFRAEERRWGRVRHSIEVKRARGTDALTRVYKRDGKEAPFDDQARIWMADALGTVFKHTDFGRDRHIERVLERDGVAGALDEIASIDSDYQTRKAYLRLLELRPGDADLLAPIAQGASGRVDSSYELAELLVALAEHASASSKSLRVTAEAAATIDSDYERRKALSAVVRASARDADVMAAVLQSAYDMDSDHERCELLRLVSETWTLDADLGRDYFESVGRMSSDYEQARALRAVIERGSLDSQLVQDLAVAVTGIDSDYHKAEVLEDLARRQPLDGAARAACVRAARTIDSDYHRRRVLDALEATES